MFLENYTFFVASASDLFLERTVYSLINHGARTFKLYRPGLELEQLNSYRQRIQTLYSGEVSLEVIDELSKYQQTDKAHFYIDYRGTSSFKELLMMAKTYEEMGASYLILRPNRNGLSYFVGPHESMSFKNYFGNEEENDEQEMKILSPATDWKAANLAISKSMEWLFSTMREKIRPLPYSYQIDFFQNDKTIKHSKRRKLSDIFPNVFELDIPHFEFVKRLQNINRLSEEISLDDVKFIVEAGLLAPSGDNCQPFCYEWSQDSLLIFHLADRAKADINNNHNASKLTFGTLLMNLEVAASWININLEVEMTEDYNRPLWCTIGLTRQQKMIHPLLPALSLRSTDRRPFEKGNIDEEIFDQLDRIAAKYEKVQFYKTKKLNNEFEKYLLKSEEYMWKHIDFFRYFSQWLRLSKKEKNSTRDGLTSESLSVNPMLILCLKLFRKFPGLIKYFFPFMKLQIYKLARKLWEHSSGIWLLTTVDSSDEAIIQAGKCGMEMWLHLNLNSYGVQPLSVSSMNSFDAQLGILPESVPRELYRNFLTGHLHFKKQFSIPDDEYPLWLFRTGKVKCKKMKQYTLRYRPEDVLKIKNTNQLNTITAQF